MARLFTPSESKYYLMALDAGTGSIRAVIFDLEGNQIAVGQAEWRHLAVPDVPGSMEFDLNKNWQLACECMRQALHNAGIAPEYIAAVSACSMREGIVLYNNEGTPIWACANVDARAAREVSELKELHNNTFENEVYRATGQTLALSAIPRLLWLAHHRSDIYRQASTITMISDWLAYMLSGDSGDVTKLGTGILTLNNDSAAYQGTTDIVGGEIAFGSDSAINMASQHINIHNSGVMSGNVTTAGDVNVMPGGTLRVAKTTVGGNLENGGTVQMNSEGGKPGNVLTVNGNYTGNNGLMTFNATLGGDNSPTDKMNVKGDTQGNTRVRVDNIGGVGAQTVNGIELIEVGGNSAGNFALTTGTVEAGAYVYTLAKGKGNDEKNWYLTSKWDGVTPADTPDPINNPPVVDPEGPSVYRPEAGSYISNIAAANSLFSHRLHDRLGEPQYTDSLHSQGSASSMWMRHVGGHERFRTGDGQLNTQANRYVLQLGGDLAQWSSNAQDRWHLGVMAGYANQHSNTQSNRVGYKSDGRISGYSAGLYATWYQNDANKTGAYVDSWALYNWFDNSVSSDNRSADDYDSRGVTASVEGGYTFEAGTFSGSEGTLNTWYVQPQVQITWMGVKDSDHTRKDGTRIETEGDGNVQTRLGVKTYLNSHHKRDNGKQREFQPYIEANWINNSKVYAVKMNGQTVSRDGARNLAEVRTGVEAKVNNNLSLWGNVGVQLGDKGYSDTQGMLGVKYSW
ncbi:autotransporter outer membrane beta-barrel domain-containing protein [Escherichia coli]|uniref:autotransporter outer membrane beta-barrel domain-containing protein n=1 Tax=Escherichia coli TaxID=562 RepID=UPI0009414683|nr:autotransporter outer membrane beta-barrel domain-containing protein [Escherichia coli]